MPSELQDLAVLGQLIQFMNSAQQPQLQQQELAERLRGTNLNAALGILGLQQAEQQNMESARQAQDMLGFRERELAEGGIRAETAAELHRQQMLQAERLAGMEDTRHREKLAQDKALAEAALAAGVKERELGAETSRFGGAMELLRATLGTGAEAVGKTVAGGLFPKIGELFAQEKRAKLASDAAIAAPQIMHTRGPERESILAGLTPDVYEEALKLIPPGLDMEYPTSKIKAGPMSKMPPKLSDRKPGRPRYTFGGFSQNSTY